MLHANLRLEGDSALLAPSIVATSALGLLYEKRNNQGKTGL